MQLPTRPSLALSHQQTVYRRVVSTPPTPQLVPAFGYVSLFPLLMQLLPPDSPELGRQLELLVDPDLLWTPYGLRSLAKASSIYKKCVPGYSRGQEGGGCAGGCRRRRMQLGDSLGRLVA